MPRWRRLTIAIILVLLALASLYVLTTQAGWHVKGRVYHTDLHMSAALDKSLESGLLALPDAAKKSDVRLSLMDAAGDAANPIAINPLYPLLAALLCLIAFTLVIIPHKQTRSP